MISRSLGGALGALSALVCAFAPSAAYAIDCNTLPGPVYGTGGSAQKPLMARIGAALAGLATPRTVIYQAPGACVGLNALLSPTGRMTGNASYWSPTGAELQCTLPLTGQVPEFASTGTAATLCAGIDALPAGFGDFEGPVTTWNFIVPTASSQQSISTDAAYFVFGFGRDSMVSPWTDETQIIRRDANSAAQIIVSLEAGIPAERFRGVDAMTNARSVSLVAMSPTPEAAIGFVSGENADANRATVRTLAFQHAGQRCGYWPDSTATSFDKRSTRDGLYWLWTTTHFFARTDSAGAVTLASARDLIGYFTGAVAAPTGVNVLELEIANGNIPLCAMRVRRTRDLGALASYAPPEPCGCYFERRATGDTTCTACTDSGECSGAAPVCRHGFCEVN